MRPSRCRLDHGSVDLKPEAQQERAGSKGAAIDSFSSPGILRLCRHPRLIRLDGLGGCVAAIALAPGAVERRAATAARPCWNP